MSETDQIDMIMAIAADPAVWDPSDDAWLMSTRVKRRDRARAAATAIRAALQDKGYTIVQTPAALALAREGGDHG